MQGPSPEHACFLQESRDCSHGSSEARVPGRMQAPAWRHYEQFPISCRELDLKGGSHAGLKPEPQ